MAKWEYKSVEITKEKGKGFLGVDHFNFPGLIEEINLMGDEGWELVNSIPIIEYQGITTRIACMFKRLKT